MNNYSIKNNTFIKHVKDYKKYYNEIFIYRKLMENGIMFINRPIFKNNHLQEIHFTLLKRTFKDVINNRANVKFDIYTFIKEMSSNLYKLHSLRIIHCDIKPENIMFSYNLEKPILIDFGTSKYDHGNIFGRCGCQSIRPPEMVNANIITTKADVWAFGMCLLYYYMDKYPIRSWRTYKDDWNNLLKEWPSIEIPYKIKLLIKKCLEPDHLKRFSAYDVNEFSIINFF